MQLWEWIKENETDIAKKYLKGVVALRMGRLGVGEEGKV